MKNNAPRNCIIGIVFYREDVGLFHVNARGDIACAINRDLNGNLHNGDVHFGATMFSDHIHNHWRDEVCDKRRAVLVDSHCVDPTKLNSGDLRRLAKKAAKLSKRH